MPSPFDAQRLRQDFPLLTAHPELVYLDTAATAQKPEAVLAAMDGYYRRHNANVHRAAHRLAAEATAAFEAARAAVARFINAPGADCIVWTRSTTEAVNLVVQSWGRSGLRAGDAILVSALEHHAMIVPWQLLAEEKGLEIRVLPITEAGELDESAWDRLFDERVKLLAVTAQSNALGTLTPLPALIARARAVGAAVLIDAAQWAVHGAIDIQALDCDFLTFSGHKLYGPTGIGVLYGKRERLMAMPPWQGGGEMIERVSFAGTSYQKPPFRFEAGTPAIAEAVGLAAALDYLDDLDRAGWQAHETALLARLDAGLDALPGVRRRSRAALRAGLASFTVDGLHTADLATLLDAQGIALRAGHHCAMPLMERLGVPGLARASLGLYTTAAEIDRFLNALEGILPRAARAPAAGPADEDALTELKAARGWEARYRVLMALGKRLPAMDPERRENAEQVRGCESEVWLAHQWRDGRLRLWLDSEARIVRGLAALVWLAYEGKTGEEIAAYDMDALFAELNLLQHLSPSRGNGLLAMVRRVRELAGEEENKN
ncbi:MAG: SufS family cysteine desulfurase [Gammaproteobacteria bacterium]|nr:SufS family cysteine desulfurase [Gammaproteobacteria bacterium]